MRYYYAPQLPSDLSTGFESFQQFDDSQDEHLDSLLRSISHFELLNQAQVDTNVVTWRGMLTKIMTAPFSYFDSWEMNVTCFQGTLFIEDNHDFKMASRRSHFSGPLGGPNQDMMSFWGYKFETLSTLSTHWCEATRPQIEDRHEHIVNNYAQYCSIVRTGFGGLKAIIGGEVDAVNGTRCDDSKQQTPWVELKTSAELVNEKEEIKFERKLLKFWAQSFLLGVPEVIVGFRNQDGILTRLQEFRTQEIPDMVARRKQLWDGQTCIDFTAIALEWLSQVVREGGVWRLRKREKSDCLELWQVDDRGTGGILTEEFKRWRLEGLPKLKHEAEVARLARNSISDQRNTDLQGNGISDQAEPP